MWHRFSVGLALAVVGNTCALGGWVQPAAAIAPLPTAAQDTLVGPEAAAVWRSVDRTNRGSGRRGVRD